ncbi:NAD(P)H-dependent oxidoreductase [Colwellia sp. 1_MG-2023]|uniref:flavodoxin family protein n=1 Tax=unclassified Colwellia TaxID=196834 RepID=UPI001C088372|nr:MULTISPECIES: NAD(P)H-dependent oxidoreductase [unclassified Colwellia]MBU2924119.1 NAD(P)H-dependent oxidoreductase [Colwellia sp. C2M11]MDO6652010.1 NAD(P)H-dependent oxidoreductase [Colwellia sp. 3_MG-2023]MDO6664786.1 NAD(P)H-dependent oxidoreductase [Colwellia sp. 2_MG-2023]MDO6689172.1 NAD(P)H-dependent oxidoreductase [Colwellia sp. 1_MG-2023]
MTDTIAVFASARSNGNTKKLIDWISGELAIDVIDLSEKNISPYDYKHNNANDDFMSVMNNILQYKKIIFATPIYWYAASAQMKVFIDRTTDLLEREELKDFGHQLRNKTSYVVCTSASIEADCDFLATFSKTFDYLGIDYQGYIHADCQNGFIADKYSADVVEFIKLVRYEAC